MNTKSKEEDFQCPTSSNYKNEYKIERGGFSMSFALHTILAHRMKNK
jgi:hypothetical protein